MYRLLIAEDEILERSALRIIINKNFENIEIVEEAKTGTEAIEYARKYKPHIILMDIKMPERNGLEAQKSIVNFLPNVKTIILTAYDDFNYAQTAIQLSAVNYILKPAKPAELVEVLIKTISSLKQSSDYNTDYTETYNKRLIEDAIKFIHKNYSENINLESVAAYVHLNPQYFSRYFKNNVGVNFIDYISKLRINKSKKLLLSTDESVSRISLRVGYIDSSYFTKVFIKHEGVSPHKFRLDNKNCTINV